MWFVYESSINTNLSPDAYPVPFFCDPKSAGTYKGVNDSQQPVSYLAAKIDPSKVDAMPEHLRADYDRANAENKSVGDMLHNPRRLRADR